MGIEMHTANIGRRTAAGAATIALGIGFAVAPDEPARAGGTSPVLVTAASDNDDSTAKTVTATCPAGTAFAAGARVVNGGGGVVLTAMMPDQQLTSVTVTAKARTGHVGPWSVVAHVTCDMSTSTPVPVTVTVRSASTAEVSCPEGTHLVGTGFRLEGSVDHTYVDEVAFGTGLRTVRVHAGGVAEPESLTAAVICKEPTQPSGPPGERVEATSEYDGVWPKTAVTEDSRPDVHSYAVGASVVGNGEFFLSALIPGRSLRGAGAEAVRASRLPAAAVGDGRQGGTDRGTDGEGEGSLTVSTLLMAAFH
ncbi:MAG: hypothetical protein SYR96_29070 [Actinomycetota bacterium]|nr:hypothetical protein [Actinomycetota bacterium]